MNGVIINPACSISSDNAEQTVDLGVITQEQIEEADTPIIYPFTINLVSCILATSQSAGGAQHTFSLKFDGPSTPGNTLFILGEASQGLAFEIHDEQGHAVIPGAMMKINEQAAENKKLNYSLHLLKTSQQVKPGTFQTAVHFTLVYQ
jgi:type 1 fimbria pilin